MELDVLVTRGLGASSYAPTSGDELRSLASFR